MKYVADSLFQITTLSILASESLDKVNGEIDGQAESERRADGDGHVIIFPDKTD